jgi:hypothetical protein
VISWSQAFAFKFNLYRYTMADDASNALGNRTNTEAGPSSVFRTGGAVSRARRRRKAQASNDDSGKGEESFQTINGGAVQPLHPVDPYRLKAPGFNP